MVLLVSDDWFLGAMKALAKNPVNTPNKPTPTIMTSIPMSLPPSVLGYRSPYPTVVMVTKVHHMASVAVRMFGSGDAVSAANMPIEPNSSTRMIRNMTEYIALLAPSLNRVRMMLLMPRCRKIRRARISLKVLNSRAFGNGKDPSKSIQPYCLKK